MPVKKFRSVEDWQTWKQAAMATACDDPQLPERLRVHWRRWSALVPYPNPRGLFKYRTREEADANRERWESERITKIRAERLRKP
ncbi:MAG TPA: hypothetical protein VE010_24815 [Thermoanaerobaculia bacterium]|nr:hypothetical protein [Thermoanaerobaculia bacterium]